MKKYSFCFLILLGLVGCSSIRTPDIPGTKKYPDGSVSFIDSVGEYNGKEVFKYVTQMPQFPGGTEGFLKFMQDNLHYPKQARDAKVEGKVFLDFRISELGDVKDIKVLKSVGSGCDEEAVRVKQLSPRWIPGKCSGKSVPVQVAIPIVFRLNE
jgi:TonB family protein